MEKTNLPLFFVFAVLLICSGAFARKYDLVVDAANGNNAQFVSQSVPASMAAGQTYPVSVTMKNIGTTTWTEAQQYRLGSQNPQDNGTWGGRIVLASGESIAPGASKTFTFNVKAPATPGTYNFQWQMLREGVEWFGDKTPNVAVNVVLGTTVSGKVAKSDGSPLENVALELCSGGTAVTDTAGNWSKVMPIGTSYCARITSGLPAGNTGIIGTGNNSCHANNSTYEWQVAGQNTFSACSAANSASWDLAADNTINFAVNYPAQVCIPGAASGCKVCNADGSGWVDTDSKCASGQVCQGGTCVGGPQNGFVSVSGENFYLNGQKWFPYGMNYWPSHFSQIIEPNKLASWFMDPYYTDNIPLMEKDLAKAQGIGLNSVWITAYSSSPVIGSTPNFTDFLNRLKAHNLKAGVSISMCNPFLAGHREDRIPG